MQIYGIDLASEKFDVSFLDSEGKEKHIVVKNTISQIEKFLEKLPSDAHLVAEHTGVYGDLLLYLADSKGIAISYVPGYEIKHSMGLVRGKSDPMDCVRIREYACRHADRLPETHFPSKNLYELKQLYATRRLLVDNRKLIATSQEGDKKRPFHNDKAEKVKEQTLEYLSEQIASIEEEMQQIIDNDEDLHRSATIVESIPGIGPVTATQLIIKTDNFRRVDSAKKCATLAGISPWPNSTGKSDKGNHVSKMGDRELKSLLFMCARSASLYFDKMAYYKAKKVEMEKKHYFVVMNNIANRLLKILYSMIKKGEVFNPKHISVDPRPQTAY